MLDMIGLMVSTRAKGSRTLALAHDFTLTSPTDIRYNSLVVHFGSGTTLQARFRSPAESRHRPRTGHFQELTLP